MSNATPSEAEPPKNLIKVKDDAVPIGFDTDGDKFKIKGSAKCSWADGGSFEIGDLRKRIEPWLTALFQSEHLSLLAGSGLTHAIHLLAKGAGAAGMNRMPFSCHAAQIAKKADSSAVAAGRATANCEDDIRVANELLRGLKILENTAEADQLQSDLESCLQNLADAVLQSERGIAMADKGKKEEAFNILVNFLMSFAARNGTRDRLHIFTTNYDRLIECGAELAGLHLSPATSKCTTCGHFKVHHLRAWMGRLRLELCKEELATGDSGVRWQGKRQTRAA